MSRAGSRISRFRPGYGRIGNSRLAWVSTVATGTIALLGIDRSKMEAAEAAEVDDELHTKLMSEVGESKIIVIAVPGRSRPLYWNLCAMTMEELEVTEEFFKHCFNEARPIVEQRDRVAADALATGDDSYHRVYRAVPQFVVRQRPELADGQGVHVGPQSLDDPAGSDGDSPV